MIENDAELEQAQRQLMLMQQAVRNLQNEVLPKNKRNFAVLAEGPMEEIRRIQTEINAFMGIDVALELESPLWLRLMGDGLHWPAAPSSLLTNYLEPFRKGLQTVAEFLQHGQISGGRPLRELRAACDLEIVAFETGSVRVGLRLPDTDGDRLFSDGLPNPAEQALDELLDAAAWAGSVGAEDELENRFADPVKRRVVLNALKPLLPKPRGSVEGVQLSGWRVRARGTISLSRDTNAKVDAAIDRTVLERIETQEGDLREIDLDELRFVLRDRSRLLEVRCMFEEDILEQAKAALDKRVRVTGSRRLGTTKKSAVLQVTRLEIIDDESTSDDSVSAGQGEPVV